jgi:hypothetical protein
MKKIFLLTSAISLIASSGCLVSDGRRHGEYRGEERHEHFEHHEEVIVEHPVVVVHPPVVVVRPPEIIVR